LKKKEGNKAVLGLIKLQAASVASRQQYNQAEDGLATFRPRTTWLPPSSFILAF
jgi:hypothetical protein